MSTCVCGCVRVFIPYPTEVKVRSVLGEVFEVSDYRRATLKFPTCPHRCPRCTRPGCSGRATSWTTAYARTRGRGTRPSASRRARPRSTSRLRLPRNHAVTLSNEHSDERAQQKCESTCARCAQGERKHQCPGLMDFA